MSWGIIIKDVEVYRVCKDKINLHIEELEEESRQIREDILCKVCQTPRTYFDESGCVRHTEDDWKHDVKCMLDELIEAEYRLTLLTHASLFPEDVEAF